MNTTDDIRYYNFEWYEKKSAKNGREPVIRHTNVKLGNFTGDTAIDTKAALGIFIAGNGNLNKNEIVRIKEFNEHGQIGEDITPSSEENAIIPERK